MILVTVCVYLCVFVCVGFFFPKRVIICIFHMIEGIVDSSVGFITHPPLIVPNPTDSMGNV